eukprot:SAG31_NODE_16856_length_692_cov_3.258010_1_plen_57_part_00
MTYVAMMGRGRGQRAKFSSARVSGCTCRPIVSKFTINLDCGTGTGRKYVTAAWTLI